MATPTFLALPRELRDEVYRHLLGSRVWIKPAAQGFLLPTAILQVGRQILSEAQEIMLKENVFVVASWHFQKSQWTIILKAPHLRVLIVCEYSSYYMEQNFAGLLAAHQGLQNLRIHFVFDMTGYPPVENLNFPEIRNVVAAVQIRDSVVLSGQMVKYVSPIFFWDWPDQQSRHVQQRRYRDVGVARSRMEKQLRGQEKCTMVDQIALRKKGESS